MPNENEEELDVSVEIKIKDLNKHFNPNYIDEMRRGYNNINLNFDLKIYDANIINKMYYFILELRSSGLNVSININSEINLTKENVIDFNRMKAKLKNVGIDKFSFDGGIGKNYEAREVYLAQTKLKNLVNRINEAQLSPYEKYLYIYDYLIKKIYKENNEDPSKSRDIVAIMNGEYIVCTGYAKLMEYICREVGIECQTQQCIVTYKDGKSYNHENNLVRIDDDKYNIHGWYYSDACWDRVAENQPNNKTFSFCLIPLADKNNMNLSINVVDDSLFYYDDKENFFKLVDGDYYGSTFGFDYSTGDYSKIIKKLGLEARYQDREKFVESTMEMINYKGNMYNYYRDKSVKKLEEIFKEKGIPADVYSKKSEVPFGCSLEFLVSMSFLSEKYNMLIQQKNGFVKDPSQVKINKYDEIINKKVDELKAYYDSDIKLDFINSARTYAEDVYEELNEMKVSRDKDSDSYKWTIVEQKIVKILMADMVMKMLKSDPRNIAGKPIEVKSYKDALMRVFSTNSKSSLQTENCSVAELVNSTIERTLKYSDKSFTEKAENDFKNEALKKKQREAANSSNEVVLC